MTRTLPTPNLIRSCTESGSACSYFYFEEYDVGFKLYRDRSHDYIQMTLDTQRRLYEQGLAPEPLSEVLEVEDGHGYWTEHVPEIGAEVMESEEWDHLFDDLLNRLYDNGWDHCDIEDNEYNYGKLRGKFVVLDCEHGSIWETAS
jgi:hypothetical protein